jgi:ribosomal protein L7/L12
MKKLFFIACLAISFAATASAQKAANNITSTTTVTKAAYSLSITNIGTNKPAVLKALISELKISDSEAHAMLNLVPGTVKTGLTQKQATKLQTALVAAGATVAIKSN